MSHGVLGDPALYEFLRAADLELAEQARANGCPSCGGVLHQANYWRQPRGGPEQRDLRFSYCCAEEGCRKRSTPASFRFLSRRVYLGVVVTLLSTLKHGATPERLDKLREHLGVSKRTVLRWRQWWLHDFTRSRLWRSCLGMFAHPVDLLRLPGSLLERFLGDEGSRLLAMLRFLLPITGGQGLAAQLD